VIFISDNGIAIPFAKSNVYYASNRTPWIVRWPGIVKPGSVDEKHHISEVEFMPTILEALGIKLPAKLDGMSHLALYKGEERNASNFIYTQIDNKVSGGPTPMRSIQNCDFVYIYNAWSDGERVFVNNAEGLTMRAMEIAAKTDKTIAERVKMFRMRIPEEYYNRNTDPGCKLNLINNPAYAKEIKSAQNNMIILMKKSGDPLLKMFQKRYDSPDVIRKLFYEVFPRAEKYDVKKSAYSKKMDSDNTENE
jgi:N-sulfoglucosamine sulfohydrolase